MKDTVFKSSKKDLPVQPVSAVRTTKSSKVETVVVSRDVDNRKSEVK